jgi:hypothetical protein
VKRTRTFLSMLVLLVALAVVPGKVVADEGSPIMVGGGGGAQVAGDSPITVGGGGGLSLLFDLAIAMIQ